MGGASLLTLIAPVGLEEPLVDWLLEHASSNGFCSGPINGHSASHESLTVAEQVSGRQRQIRFEVHAQEGEVNLMLERLRGDFADAGIHFWVVPLLESGKI
ncbi:MAG: DUF3240 family protein [Methylococcaceae bacterium]|nr:DUF3240 family protein [Methylococcaceae bacterium]